jgi:hypothetical protein
LCDLETSKEDEAVAYFGPQHHRKNKKRKKTVNPERTAMKLKFFSPKNAHFIKHIKCSNLQLKHLCIRSYMFRSNSTILRDPMLILAKVTLL